MHRVSLIAVLCLAGLLSSCGINGTQATIVAASADISDTLAETSVLLFQWVNTQDVRAEFDFTIDADAPQHVELPPRSVVNLRLTGQCPQSVTFTNIEFADEFFAGTIPFLQYGFASEGDRAAESCEFIPASFFCFSSWQIVINDSNITVAAMDRQANSEDEGESTVTDLFSTDTTNQTSPPPRSDPNDPNTLDPPSSPDPTTLSGPGGGTSNDDNGGDDSGGIGRGGGGELHGPASSN